MAREIGLSWPFSDAQGRTPDYLAGVSDENLLALGRASKWLSWEMVPGALTYDRLLAQRAGQQPGMIKSKSLK